MLHSLSRLPPPLPSSVQHFHTSVTGAWALPLLVLDNLHLGGCQIRTRDLCHCSLMLYHLSHPSPNNPKNTKTKSKRKLSGLPAVPCMANMRTTIVDQQRRAHRIINDRMENNVHRRRIRYNLCKHRGCARAVLARPPPLTALLHRVAD